ncbi:MAG: GNAT family N-acetyltransferase [Pseudomonadales bacterium]|nr:GNAT family N-acetyltransferase [Pseudomonadales bacterium]
MRLDIQKIPWDLLLEADPNRALVEEYLSEAFTRVAWYADSPVGVYALKRLSATSFELMNISVASAFQGSGLGRRLLGHAIGLAEAKGGREVHLGTGNSSLGPLRLYQRMGFRIVDVIPDYYTEHYAQALEEDGIACIDMLRLKLTLTPE